jgi:hypothetical protein
MTDGNPVLLGSSAPTRLDAGEVADTDPAAFDAVTTTLTVDPTAPDSSLSVEATASETLLQLPPVELHSCHW